MPIPMRIARINRVVTNRLLGPVAARAPGLGIVEHVGRRSGRLYRTPVAVFRRGDTATFALTYGPGSEWVRNVLAAGGCQLRARGRTLTLREPRLLRDETRRVVPAPVRLGLRLLRAADFLEMRIEGEPPRTARREER